LAYSYSKLNSQSMNPFRCFGRTQTGIGPSQGLYLRRTAQHKYMLTYSHTSSGIRTHHLSVRAVQEIRDTDRAVTGANITMPYGHKLKYIRISSSTLNSCNQFLAQTSERIKSNLKAINQNNFTAT